MEAILPYYCYGLRFSIGKHNQISTNTMAVSYSHIIFKQWLTHLGLGAALQVMDLTDGSINAWVIEFPYTAPDSILD